MRTGAKCFFMSARLSDELIVKPSITCSADVNEFFWFVLGRSPERVAQPFEQYASGGLAGKCISLLL